MYSIFRIHNQLYNANSLIRSNNYKQYLDKYEPIVQKWDMLKRENVSDDIIAKIVGVSRATYYRYRKIIANIKVKNILPVSRKPKRIRQSKISIDDEKLILRLRRENPTYGKAKISVIMKRDHGSTLSESSVGRVIKKLQDKGRIIKSVSALRLKRERKFAGHTKKWRYGMKADKCGALVQIDHMSVTKNGTHIKHFQAWDSKSKFLFADVFSNATSATARKFLLKLIAETPFTITSIQVDGGSEFMADFENECGKLGIALYVLPPRRPQYNGGVERGNRIMREEFYANSDMQEDSVQGIRYALKKALDKYNYYRPHFNLHGLTPMEYIEKYSSLVT